METYSLMLISVVRLCTQACFTGLKTEPASWMTNGNKHVKHTHSVYLLNHINRTKQPCGAFTAVLLAAC